MSGLELVGLLLAGYAGIVAFLVWRLLHPGIGRPIPGPVPWIEPRSLEVDGTRLHVGVFDPGGGAPVCILQHGLGESGDALAAEADLLRRLGFGIVLMDLPGHGRSGFEATTYGVREGHLLARVIGALDVADRVTIAWGRSVGAATVLHVAPSLPALRAVITDGMFDNPLRSIARHAVERPRYRWLLPVLPGVVLMIYLYLRARRAIVFPEALVGRVAVPILFVTGTRDIGMPPRVQWRLKRGAAHPASEVIAVPDAGHYGCFPRAPGVFESWLTRWGCPAATRQAAV